MLGRGTGRGYGSRGKELDGGEVVAVEMVDPSVAKFRIVAYAQVVHRTYVILPPFDGRCLPVQPTDRDFAGTSSPGASLVESERHHTTMSAMNLDMDELSFGRDSIPFEWCSRPVLEDDIRTDVVIIVERVDTS